MKQFYFPNGSTVTAVNADIERQLVQMSEPYLNPDAALCQIKRMGDQNTPPVDRLERFDIKIQVQDLGNGNLQNDTTEVINIVHDWASQSLCPLAGGRRFAMVDLVSTEAVGNRIELTFEALVATVVWLNDRHVTIGFPNGVDNWKRDLELIVAVIPKSAKATKIESANFGDLLGEVPIQKLHDNEALELKMSTMGVIKVLSAGPDGIEDLMTWMARFREATRALELKVAELAESRD